MKTKNANLITLAVLLLNLLITLILLPRLPARLPMHWNIAGEVDRYGGRNELLILAFVPIGVFLLMYLLSLADKRLRERAGTYWAIIRSVILLMVIIQYTAIAMGFGRRMDVGSIFLALMGVVFVIIGNYLPQLKQNTVAGIRLPWTLKDEETWRVTHRVGGYYTIAVGAVMVLASFFVPNRLAFFVLMLSVVTWGMVLTLYSFLYYRRKRARE